MDDLPIAEPAQRLVARLIDTLLIGLPVVLVARAFFDEETVTKVVAPLALAALLLAYEPPQLWLWGATLGKRFAGIKVISAKATGTLGWMDAVIRTLVYATPIAFRPVRIVDVIAGIVWIASVAWLLERPRRQALHDRMASTLVIDVRRS